MRLLISGGGTGGHVYPGLVVAAELQKQEAESRRHADASSFKTSFLYVGRAEGIEARLSANSGIPFQPIDAGAIRGMAVTESGRNLWRTLQSIGQVRSIIRTFEPDVVFATGGYVSAPVIWASALERVPSVIYLPDLAPGWAIRASARWATRIAISFPEVGKYFSEKKTVVTGYPVRAEFYEAEKSRARDKFELERNAHTVTIFGGSRGAHRINQAAAKNLEELATLAQIIIVTGREDEEWFNRKAKGLGELSKRVRVFGYLDKDFVDALAAADVVVSRAGAATLGEFPASGLPAIMVPYPFAGRHQEKNARFLVDRGAAIRVDDSLLDEELVPILKKMFDSPEQLKKMSEASRQLARRDAAANIAALLESLAGANA